MSGTSLNGNGELVMRSSVTSLKKDEQDIHELQERQQVFNEKVHERIGNYAKAVTNRLSQKPDNDHDIYHTVFFGMDDHSEDMVIQELDEDDSPVTMPYHDKIPNLNTPCLEYQGNLVGAEVSVPTKDGHIQGKVKKREMDQDTNMLVGTCHQNPLFDTRIYKVELQDGTYTDYSANVLIENIMSSTNDNGQIPMFINEIVVHRFDENVIPG